MAAPERKKRLDKRAPPPETPTATARFFCSRCGKAYYRREIHFHVSHSPMYRGTGFFPWCTECIDEMYEEYRAKYKSDRDAVRRMCMKLDLYWSDEIYDMVERTVGDKPKMRTYASKTNLTKYLGKTFDDTLREEAMRGTPVKSAFEGIVAEDAAEDDTDVVVERRIIDFWGPGYSAETYKDLERRYAEWTEGRGVIEPERKTLYRNICLLEMNIARDAAEGKAVDKNMATLNSILSTLNIQPVQKEGEDEGLKDMPLGVGIDKWEYHRPLPPTPKELCDRNGWVKNITTWFLGHACKMVGLRNSYTKLYEDAMNELRVSRPEYDDEDDDTFLADIFGGSHAANDNQNGGDDGGVL